MSFDFELGHFKSVGVSAATVAFEWLGYETIQLTRFKATALQSAAAYVGLRHGRPCIGVYHEAESGMMEFEFAMWRELARAWDRMPAFTQGVGRHSGCMEESLRVYALRNADSWAAQDRVKAVWTQRMPIPGSPSHLEPFEATAFGVTDLPDHLERMVAVQLRSYPAEVFAQAIARFVAVPANFSLNERALGDQLARIILSECGVTVRR